MSKCPNCSPHPAHSGRRCWEEGMLDSQCPCGKELGDFAKQEERPTERIEDDGAP